MILKEREGSLERRWSSRRRSCATPRVGVVDDLSQDCGQDAVPATLVTVIVMNALYGVLGLISSIYYSRPALRLYQVHHVDASVGSPASSHKCGGGDHKCGQARVGPRWSSIIQQLSSPTQTA